MNLGEIMGPGGMIDLERLEQLRAMPQASAEAVVTVRQWDATLHRSLVLYRGPMRFADIRNIGDREPLANDEEVEG